MADKPRDRPTVPEVLPLVWAYYRKPGNAVGGNLHIVLDDGNVYDEHIQFCLDRCVEEGDADGEALARFLLQMTRTQRKKLSSKAYDDPHGWFNDPLGYRDRT